MYKGFLGGPRPVQGKSGKEVWLKIECVCVTEM